MDTTKSRSLGVGYLQCQVRQFLSRFAQIGTQALSSLIQSEQLQSVMRQHCPNYRERIYSPLTTMGLFLEQVLGADHSCQDAVARGLSGRVAQDLPASSLNTGPYCKARQRLSEALLMDVCKSLGQKLCQASTQSWRWRGREIKLVDGTTVSMPDTDLNQAAYPQSKQQKAGLGFPVMRIVGIISLGCGAVLDWAQGACAGKQTGETSMLRQLSAALSRGDIVLMDRYYTGYFMVAVLLGRGADFVSRQHQLRHTDFEQGMRLGKGDHVAQWLRPQRPKWMTPEEYEQVPLSLQIRETRVGEWVLISSLNDAKAVTRQDLNELYGWRWHVELDIRAIKTVMQMDVLRCKTPQMVVKEVAAHLLAYNLVRSVMAQAANRIGCKPRQLSFKGALQQLRAFEEQLRHGAYARVASLCEVLISAVAQMKLLHRPGRVEPRAVKRREANSTLLTQPRHLLRAKLQAQRDLIMTAVYA